MKPLILARPLGARTALVIEDDLRSAELIRVQLEAEGFRVLHAPDPIAALAIVRDQPLALIMLDLMFPGMDGWELLAHVKSDAELATIPVVIISILADRSRGLALGAAAVMQKPFTRRELSSSLQTLGLISVSQEVA